METVLVLGSNCFSAQDFVELLLSERDYLVVGVSRNAEYPPFFLAYRSLEPDRVAQRFRFHALDLNRDFDALCALIDEIRPSYVVNFAALSEVAVSWQFPEHFVATNVTAAVKLGDFLRKKSFLKRYLQISSPEAYGSCQGVVRESHPENPSTPYAASKAAADLFLSTYAKQYNFPCVTIRATNVYGARQQLFKIIPRSFIYLKQERKIQLHGGGQAVKSFIHIRDVSRGELLAMEKGRNGERYHLSPDHGISIRDLVQTICQRQGRDFSRHTEMVNERPGQDAAYVIDSSKARNELGWTPQIELEQGLDEVARWVDLHWDEIQKLPLSYQHKA